MASDRQRSLVAVGCKRYARADVRRLVRAARWSARRHARRPGSSRRPRRWRQSFAGTRYRAEASRGLSA